MNMLVIKNESKTGVDLKQDREGTGFAVAPGVNEHDGLHLGLMAGDC